MANPTMIAIASYTVTGSATSSFSFTNIPQTYDELVLIGSVRLTNTQYGYEVRVHPNGSTANATSQVLRATAGNSVSTYSINYLSLSDNCLGDGATANVFTSAEMHIYNYTSSNNKATRSESISENNASEGRLDIIGGNWANSAPITSLTLQSVQGPMSMKIGSKFYLYGIKKS